MNCSKDSIIGKGAFGNVFNCKNNDKIVVKESIDKDELFENEKNYFEYATEHKETKIYFFSFVVKIRSYDITENGHTQVVMDRCGNTLEDFIQNKQLNETQTMVLIDRLLAAVNYLHIYCDHSHNDIKPSNICISKITNKNADIKFLDMGSSQCILKETHLTPFTPHYAAPHVYEEVQYDFLRDMWAVGCTIYETVAGVPFFHNMTNEQIMGFLFRTDLEHYEYMVDEKSTKPVYKYNSNMLVARDKFFTNLRKVSQKNRAYITKVVIECFKLTFENVPLIMEGGVSVKKHIMKRAKSLNIDVDYKKEFKNRFTTINGMCIPIRHKEFPKKMDDLINTFNSKKNTKSLWKTFTKSVSLNKSTKKSKSKTPSSSSKIVRIDGKVYERTCINEKEYSLFKKDNNPDTFVRSYSSGDVLYLYTLKTHLTI